MRSKYFTALKEASRNLFRTPNTVLFPLEQVETPVDLRGPPVVDEENCTLCMRCERVCPTSAIKIEKLSKTEGYITVDLGRCCYCQECEDTCNFDAIVLKPEWMTSDLVRDSLKTKYMVVKE